MAQKKYVIGVDFGTLSGRAVLVDVTDGTVAAQREKAYPHAVMTSLPEGKPLPLGWALQDPADYLDVLESTIPYLLTDAGIEKEQVAGLAWDVTSCTMLPARADGTPLCFLEEYREHPHAYVKLWKHHAAQPNAQQLEDFLSQNAPELLKRYGGKVSSQWMLPKIMQILEQAPEIYQASDLFLEVVDWISLQLTGRVRRNTCCAGFKIFWDEKTGFPAELFTKLDPRFADLAEKKLRGEMVQPWQPAGTLREDWAQRLGLTTDVVVAGGLIDAHAGVLGSRITDPGQMLMVLGTSTCHMLLANEAVDVQGICGRCKDGILPGAYAYEAGQACVGDMLDWFIRNHATPHEVEQAKSRGINVHQWFTEQVTHQRPGESGLLALDWWNGVRTPLVDDRLTGLMLGMTLRTTPAEEYRALVESTAYGSRLILDTFVEAGVTVNEIFACGGIAGKNPMMMQIYADVLGRPVHVAQSTQGPALGSAILAACASGLHDEVKTAVEKMTLPSEKTYYPRAEESALYQQLYRQYRELVDWFGRGGSQIMARLGELTHRHQEEQQ